jgi:hypothetical protein
MIKDTEKKQNYLIANHISRIIFHNSPTCIIILLHVHVLLSNNNTYLYTLL